MLQKNFQPRRKALALVVSGFAANLTPHEVTAAPFTSCQTVWNESMGSTVLVTGGDCTIGQGTIVNISDVIGLQSAGIVGTIWNNGTIASANIGVANIGTLAAFVNATGGYLGSPNGFHNATQSSVGTLANNAGATIASSGSGVLNAGSITLLRNDGFINAGDTGVSNTGSIATLVNRGTISGRTGVFNDAQGSIGSIVNTGLITGSRAAIISGYSPPEGATLSTITNTGIIAGGIGNSSTQDMTIVGGTGTVFGTLTGVNGSIGAFDNARSNLTITGNQFLNDHVNLITLTAMTLVSEAGSLRVNNPITIAGNYTLRATGTLLIGVSSSAQTNGAESDTGYGRLVVTDRQSGALPGSGPITGPREGNVTIEPGASVKLVSTGASYGFAAGQRYVVIQATGTVNYNANQLNYGIVGSRYSVSGAEVTDPVSGNHDLVLRVGDSIPDAVVPPVTGEAGPGATPAPISPTTRNAIAALGGLRSYTGVSDPGLLNLYNASLALGSVAEANRAGAQLSPTQQLAASRAAAAPTFDALSLLGIRADGLRIASAGRSGIATGDGATAHGVWGQAFGGHASQGMVDAVPGYRANYGGLLIGIDRSLNERWSAGGAFSYSHTRINGSDDNAGSSTQVNGYGLLAYASYLGSPWYVNLSGAVVQQRYNTTRVVDFTGFSGTANGAFSGQQYVARTEFGYPLPIGSATLTPLASLTYSYLHQSAYTETGGSGAALAVGSAHTSSLRSALGTRLEQAVSTRYGDVVPFAQLQWIHEFVNSRAVTGASYAGDVTGETAFTTVGASPVRDLADFALGATLVRSSRLSLTLRYEVQAGSRFVSQTGSLRLQQRF